MPARQETQAGTGRRAAGVLPGNVALTLFSGDIRARKRGMTAVVDTGISL
ncbi:MAG: hypothetical protein WHT46_04375 [Candidatus Geothermincolales bacterium]